MTDKCYRCSVLPLGWKGLCLQCDTYLEDKYGDKKELVMDKDQALRYNKGKPMLGLIDAEFEKELGKVLTAGAAKYAKENWRKGLPWSEVVDSMKRHINSFVAGEDKDPETDCHHMAHVACNAMFLVWFATHRKDFDDRYKEPTSPSVAIGREEVP